MAFNVLFNNTRNFYLDNSDINDDVCEKVSHFRNIKSNTK